MIQYLHVGMRSGKRWLFADLDFEVRAGECVFVDDLPFNLTPARELGMATIHHTDSASTVSELERLLGIALGAGERA